MIFAKPLVRGVLVKRHKRFLAEVKLENGQSVWAHCTNSGSMKSCLEEGAAVYLTPVDDPKRLTQFTWEMIEINGKWVGINTSQPNKLAYDVVVAGEIAQLAGYVTVNREVVFGDSRFDLFAENEYQKCFIEVKNVSYKHNRYALFPDAVTTRGQKHLETLIQAKAAGYRAVMLYIIQRSDVEIFGPATNIDPVYARILQKAVEAGVEVIPVQAMVTPEEIKLGNVLPFDPEPELDR